MACLEGGGFVTACELLTAMQRTLSGDGRPAEAQYADVGIEEQRGCHCSILLGVTRVLDQVSDRMPHIQRIVRSVRCDAVPLQGLQQPATLHQIHCRKVLEVHFG
jgi:hypothetical protein